MDTTDVRIAAHVNVCGFRSPNGGSSGVHRYCFTVAQSCDGKASGLVRVEAQHRLAFAVVLVGTQCCADGADREDRANDVVSGGNASGGNVVDGVGCVMGGCGVTGVSLGHGGSCRAVRDRCGSSGVTRGRSSRHIGCHTAGEIFTDILFANGILTSGLRFLLAGKIYGNRHCRSRLCHGRGRRYRSRLCRCRVCCRHCRSRRCRGSRRHYGLLRCRLKFRLGAQYCGAKSRGTDHGAIRYHGRPKLRLRTIVFMRRLR